MGLKRDVGLSPYLFYLFIKSCCYTDVKNLSGGSSFFVSKNISFLFLFYDKKGLSLCCVCGMIGSEFQKDITLRKIRKIYGVKGRKQNEETGKEFSGHFDGTVYECQCHGRCADR